MSKEKNAYTQMELTMFPQNEQPETEVVMSSFLDGMSIKIDRMGSDDKETLYISSTEARQIAKYLNILADHQEQEHGAS